MAVTAGDKIGPYEILAAIGAGGMGEVYRARDTKLKRDVALKVLPEAFAADRERMARFQREAEVLASLNHPNIAQIYGVEERALVMELVDGESPKGPMAFDEAWKIALQISDALDYAHEKGIVHRDLKPDNVKVRPDGLVKLLDFGLAKAFSDQPESGESDPANSPTVTLGATVAGTILGTAAYMAPEQAKGKRVDKRADIWSWGVVLYELLTGERMFQGDGAAATLAQVLTKEPDLDHVPLQARKLLRRCLEKDPKQRLRDIGEARFLLEAGEPPRVVSKRPSSFLTAILGAVAIMALAAAGYLGYRHYTEEVRVVKLSLLAAEKADPSIRPASPVVSPDGRHAAFTARMGEQGGLWIRDLDGLSARLLPGTEAATDPFWAPDSRWVGFFAGSTLKKINTTGGPALSLCDVAGLGGGTWNRDGVIVYGNSGGLFRVSAMGGIPTRLKENDRSAGFVDYRAPWFLPDGRRFLYTARTPDPQQIRIYVDSIEAQPARNTSREVLRAPSNAVYAAGHLLYSRDRSTLLAQPFDPARAQTSGEAVAIAERVDFLPSRLEGQFSVSDNGVLIYTSGTATADILQLTWFDRSGKGLGTVGTPADIEWPAISPDGTQVAESRRDSSGVYDIWLHDLARNTASRFTFGPQNNRHPVWSPDGYWIAFHSFGGKPYPYRKAASGIGKEEPIDEGPPAYGVDDWSRDGRYLIEETIDSKSRDDIWVIPKTGDKKPFPFLNSPFRETNAKLSPNGEWLAYSSDESQRSEVYVQTFPEHGGKWQVSTRGGDYPVWSRDGRELYFISADRKLTAVEVRGSGAKFEAGVPKPLFEVRAAGYYDVSKEGRFLMAVPQERAGAIAAITVVLNWQAGLRK